MENSATRTRGVARPALEVVGLTVVAFLVALVAGVVFIVPLVALGYDVQTTAVLLAATAVGQAGFLVVGYLYARFRDVSVSISSPSARDVAAVVAGTLLALILAVALSVVLSVLELVPESVIAEAGMDDPTFLLGLAALSVVLVAPAEEWLFRGVIQGRLRQRVGAVPAVVGSSLLFGSMHLANYTGALVPIVAGATLIAVVGGVFGALYEYTGNLAVPIAVHAVYNVVLLSVSYLAV
jgi:hypothetical protein